MTLTIVLIVCVAFVFALVACDRSNDGAYKTTQEKWDGIFTGKSMLTNGNFTVEYSVTPVGESAPTVSGTFKVDGNKFEVYKFAPGDAKLKEAESGSLTLNISGFGEYTMKCAVNGNYIMVYSDPDDAVIEAFKSVETK